MGRLHLCMFAAAVMAVQGGANTGTGASSNRLPAPAPTPKPVRAALVALPPRSTPSFCNDDGDWKLAWQDEFEAGALDSAVWTVPVGAGSSFGRDANVTHADTYIEASNIE